MDNKQRKKDRYLRILSVLLTLICLLIIFVIMTFYMFKDNGLVDNAIGFISGQSEQEDNGTSKIKIKASNKKIDSGLRYVVLNGEYTGKGEYEELTSREFKERYKYTGDTGNRQVVYVSGIHSQDIKDVYINKGMVVVELGNDSSRIKNKGNKFILAVLLTKQDSYETDGLLID